MQAHSETTPATVKLEVTRKYLHPHEIKTLLDGTRSSRQPDRNRLAILMMFKHGLRVGELVALRWSQVDFNTARLDVHRLKNGIDTVHPIPGDVLRLLRKLHRASKGHPNIFMSERSAPLTPSGIQDMVAAAGRVLPFKPTPHMLRHSCGYWLANEKQADLRMIQAYLGHANIQNTTIYTTLNSKRFEGLF